MSGSGLSALIYCGAWLANEFDLEVLTCGRAANDADSVLELCDRFLFFTISLNVTGVTLAAQPMDTGDGPDLLLRTSDNENGWQTTRGVIAALERHGIKSLERPIEAGTGEFGWVIG